MYVYLKNLQGDIIGILDNNKSQIVSYTYDSWGKVISVKDEDGKEITDPNHIGKINPYRYRSYRYDEETGLYYLNSRYYNPEWGRFLNGDNYGGQVGKILTHNIYAYCGNNPINRSDSSGLFWQELFETVVQTIQGWTPAYAGAGGIALVDGPLPFGDAIAAGLTVGITVGAIGYSAYKVATIPKATTKDKAEAIPRTPPKQIKYWKASNNAIRGMPLSYLEAQKEVRQGRNIICDNQIAAFQIAKWYPEMIGPEIDRDKNGNPIPGHYPHYHINKRHGAPHIWFYEK